MSRISKLERDAITPEMNLLYDRIYAQRGNVPNMFRTMAHRPEIFSTMMAHFSAVLNTGTVSTKLKELIIVRTSQINATPYCLASHTALLADWVGPATSSIIFTTGRAAPTSRPPKRRLSGLLKP